MRKCHFEMTATDEPRFFSKVDEIVDKLGLGGAPYRLDYVATPKIWHIQSDAPNLWAYECVLEILEPA